MSATSRSASSSARRGRAEGGVVEGRPRGSMPASILARAYLLVLSTTGVLSLLLVVLTGIGILHPMRVASDSMTPAFAAGDLILATIWPTAWIGAGDVVVARSAQGDRRDIAHRVVETAPTPDGAELRLRGDANPVPDSEAYPVGRTVSRVWFSIPDGAEGYSVLTRPQVGVPILGGLALLAILAATTASGDASSTVDASAQSRFRRGRRR